MLNLQAVNDNYTIVEPWHYLEYSYSKRRWLKKSKKINGSFKSATEGIFSDLRCYGHE